MITELEHGRIDGVVLRVQIPKCMHYPCKSLKLISILPTAHAHKKIGCTHTHIHITHALELGRESIPWVEWSQNLWHFRGKFGILQRETNFFV